MTGFILPVIVGAAAGALAGCGVGGGSLLLLYMTALGGVSYTDAKWINLLFFGVTAALSLISHIKNGLIEKRATLICSLCGMVTAAVTAFWARSLSNGALGKIFAALFIIAGLRELFAKDPKKDKK